MTIEIVVGGGALLLLLLFAGTIVGLWRGQRAEHAARGQLDTTRARGALPPSLHPKVDPGLCIGSGSCVEVCPEVDVLAVIDGKAELVNPTACIGHGECLRACPVDAISLVLGHEKRGVDIPMVASDFQTDVEGLYIVGELGGMGLIYNAMTQALQCMTALRSSLPPPVEGAHQLFIVGAGPAGDSAVEAAIALGGAGAVTQLCYRKKSFDRIKPKNAKRLDAAVSAGQVSLVLESTPTEVRAQHVVVKSGDTLTEHENDYVIVNIGGVLPTRFLEASGVKIQTFRGEAFAPANP